MPDSRKKTLAKTVSWRIISFLLLLFVAGIFTRDLTLTLSIGLVDVIIKMILFYIHERIWTKIKF